MANKEVWVQLKYHTNYEVSNFGRVRNKLTNHILKASATSSHKNPTIRLDGKFWQSQLTLSWIVWNAFHESECEWAECWSRKGHRLIHIDGNLHNNRLDNLRLY